MTPMKEMAKTIGNLSILGQSTETDDVSNEAICMMCAQDDQSTGSANSDDSVAYLFMMHNEMDLDCMHQYKSCPSLEPRSA